MISFVAQGKKMRKNTGTNTTNFSCYRYSTAINQNLLFACQ